MSNKPTEDSSSDSDKNTKAASRPASTRLANKILTSKMELSENEQFSGRTGCFSTIFLIWYLVSMTAVFVGMMVYFLYTSCSPQVALVDLTNPSSFFSDAYNSGPNHICASYVEALVPLDDDAENPYYAVSFSQACVLKGFSCSEYGTYNMDACAYIDCNPNYSCYEGLTGTDPVDDYYDPYPDTIAGPSVSINYITCYDLSTAFVNSM